MLKQNQLISLKQISMSKLKSLKQTPKNRKAISKQKSKKVTKVSKAFSLEDHLRELLTKAHTENHNLESKLSEYRSQSTDSLLQSSKLTREWSKDITEFYDKFNTLNDKAKQLRTDFDILLLNPKAEEIKDRITLCKKLEDEIPEFLNILNGKKSALKEILKSVTESLREIEVEKGVLNG